MFVLPWMRVPSGVSPRPRPRDGRRIGAASRWLPAAAVAPERLRRCLLIGRAARKRQYIGARGCCHAHTGLESGALRRICGRRNSLASMEVGGLACGPTHGLNCGPWEHRARSRLSTGLDSRNGIDCDRTEPWPAACLGHESGAGGQSSSSTTLCGSSPRRTMSSPGEAFSRVEIATRRWPSASSQTCSIPAPR